MNVPIQGSTFSEALTLYFLKLNFLIFITKFYMYFVHFLFLCMSLYWGEDVCVRSTRQPKETGL